MSTSLVRQSLEASLASSSLGALVKARQAQKQTFLLLDCSGSMADRCGTDGTGPRKIDQLREVVNGLSVACPLVGFGLDTTAEVGLITRIPEPLGSTPLDKAIDFAAGEGAQRLIVISDGQPNSPDRTIAAAQRYGQRIDVYYVGPPGGPGEAFLYDLARQTGGVSQTIDLKAPEQLTSGIRALLSDGRKTGER